MARIFAITFAREGSKGIKGKNIKHMNGKPLLAYSIDLAKKIPTVHDIFVSTDGTEIAEIAREYGAEVIIRPAELASDCANEWDAWQHAIKYLKANFGMHDDDLLLSLPCTSPLRSLPDINKLIEEFKDSSSDLALCITESARNPYFNMVNADNSGIVNLVCDAGKFHRRQDVPKVYDITTVGYLTTARFISSANGVLSGKTLGVVVPRASSIDIDEQLDFDFAELLLKKQEQI
ncbi:acylneuraminate cytidylyltransferase [Pseudoalteromonas sp. NCCP-2140]|uniref:acylneuraminate cytidylyltransferase family protein n=1 Tax=Pseudoalteromonas sp. NCCP-2140 TaxID=2942288 RepID=UPI00203E2C14|nr:acylneuraminate cytidylyltransferase family protein [Pseudoalteromonas sp. NCCP-2140]GKW51895.1 acylneuraminate cytidylyltransferase [Pseudoalteromonas sp. NCCP-2140]